jgi:hypothetical protein
VTISALNSWPIFITPRTARPQVGGNDRYNDPLNRFTSPKLCSYVALYCCTPTSLPLLLRAGSPSLIIDARRPHFPYCCVHAPPPSLLAQHLPYCCTLYPILAFCLVFYLTLSLRLKDSAYCCLALALGAQTLDSSAIDLVYINRDCLCHLWDQRGQAKLTEERGS